MLNIEIKTIPHKEQRYDTVGDYYETPEGLKLRVSEQDNPFYEMLITIHELVEYALIKAKGISIEAIDDFDMAFKGEGEPGDDPESPYYHEHQMASIVERQVCEAMGVKWCDYDRAVEETGAPKTIKEMAIAMGLHPEYPKEKRVG